MGIYINIGEAKTRLSELVAAALRGEEVILQKAGQPKVKLVALDDAKALAKAERAAKWDKWIGSFEGKFPPGAGDLFLEPSFTDEEMDVAIDPS